MILAAEYQLNQEMSPVCQYRSKCQIRSVYTVNILIVSTDSIYLIRNAEEALTHGNVICLPITSM